MEMKHLTVVIKPTRNCNLRCKYCSVGEPTCRTLTQAETATVIERIVTRSPESSTKFIWHGGEPLLPGIDFYEKVLEVERPLMKNGYRISNVVQTNGTLITKEWGRFFKKNRFGVGLSIDGPKEVNDRTRVFPGEFGTFDAIKRGSAILDKFKIKHGYLTVINQYNVADIDAIIDFMHRENKSYKLVAVSPIGRAADAYDTVMTAGDTFSRSQIHLLDRWLKEGDSADRSALWKYMVALLTNKPIECIFLRDCQQTFIGVDCNADVYPCGRFCGSGNFLYGNLMSDSFKQVISHPSRIALTERPEQLKKCRKCRYFSICNGGCPLQGVLNGGIGKEDYNCRQYLKIFSAIEKEFRKAAGI